MMKLVLSVIVISIALIPTWLFIGLRSLLSPQGFFQKFFVLGVGIYFFFGAQILMAIFGFLGLIAIMVARIP